MTKDDIQLLFEFDRWANSRVLEAVSTLNADKFTRDLGGSFRSVRDTFVHIVGSESSWLRCWKEPSPSAAFIDDVWTRHDARFDLRMRFLISPRCSQSGRKSRKNKSSL